MAILTALTAYKCFGRTGEQLHSVAARNLARVDYVVGRDILPPRWLSHEGYGLTGFSSLAQAINYQQQQAEWRTNPLVLEIWKVEGVQMKLPRTRCSNMTVLAEGLFDPSFPQHMWFWPPGTIMFESVRLVKRMIRH